MAVRGGIGVQDRRGLAAAIPAGGIYGRWFYATDTDTWYFDDGTSWVTDPSGGGLTINNIQRGTIALTNGNASATATVTSVDTTMSLLTYLGGSTTNLNTNETDFARIVLTDATTVTATRSNSNGSTVTVSWELVEYA